MTLRYAARIVKPAEAPAPCKPRAVACRPCVRRSATPDRATRPGSRIEVAGRHARALPKRSAQSTHVLTMGFSGKRERIDILEADDPETLRRMNEDLRVGAESRAIDIVDAVVAIPLANEAQFERAGSRQRAG